jgi:hypothetical protein
MLEVAAPLARCTRHTRRSEGSLRELPCRSRVPGRGRPQSDLAANVLLDHGTFVPWRRHCVCAWFEADGCGDGVVGDVDGSG